MSKSEKKQAAIVVHEYGGPEVLKYEEIQRPEPKDDEILIRVISAGVNAVDASIRAGKFAKVFGTRLPFIPGSDIAGVVEKAGSKITKFKNGDSVFAYTDLKDGGGYAEYIVATEREASPQAPVAHSPRGRRSADRRISCMAGINRHRETQHGSDRAYSRRIGWGRNVCDSNR